MKKSLTIEELRSRIGKPIFVIATTEEFKNKTAWYVISKIHEFKADNENRGYIEFTDYDYIDLEKIQFFRFFDTEATEKELAEILKEEEKAKKKTGYERVGKEESYYYTETSYFNDEKLAKNIARAEQLKYKLRRYAALNGGIPSQADWGNSYVAKYEIIGESDNFIHATKNFESRAVGAIYFKDIEACKKAIEIFKKELIWYFTEFQEMLY
ncbi:MAG: hypothetical protein IPM51_12000 [Sphingobacteriaceae bacterium]|nr:hypothetical protein [Sphingobacteriaceae bacterium]